MLARWHTGTKAQTLQFLRECDRPDIPNILNPLAAVEDEEGVTDWDVACLECRVCTARQVAVFPHELEWCCGQECHVCHGMTADTKEIEYEDHQEGTRNGE